ncbi:CAP domain-containing protein [Planctomycetales bacterium ZRK34]|nr:CAP domain-containing protein [Planctomycetales bacterium ZRK34]
MHQAIIRLWVVALLISLSAAVMAADKPDPRVPKALLVLHNRLRAKADKPELQLNDTLTAIAQRYADYLAESGKLGHEEQGTLSDRLQVAGYRYRRAGENLARGQRSPKEAVSSWFQSPPHRANMLGDFDEVGFGYARSRGGEITWVAVFATPAPKP